MPEYLAPGVYVEEVSFRSKSIEGVSTTTTGFVGPARYGPVDLEPDIITSLAEFEQVYGDRLQLKFGADNDNLMEQPNFVWHAVRAFFDNGGRRLYIARAFQQRSNTDDGRAHGSLLAGVQTATVSDADKPNVVTIKARFPGAAGKMRVQVAARLGQNVLGAEADGKTPRAASLLENDVVWISDVRSPIDSPPGGGSLYIVGRDEQGWLFDGPGTLRLNQLQPGDDQIRVVTLTITVFPNDPEQLSRVWNDLPPDPRHMRAGQKDSFAEQFAEEPANLALKRSLPIVVELGANLLDDGADRKI